MSNESTELLKLLTRREIEVAWGETIEVTPKASFESGDVPQELRALIPYAVFWGVSDDWIREDVLKRTPVQLKKNLKWAVAKFDDPLDAWLAGPEASSSDPTDAYVAFSAMRMGADFI
jgi:hypothetical protein